MRLSAFVRAWLRAPIPSAAVGGAILAIAFAAPATAQSADAHGWFSPEQVVRGADLYERRCAECHGEEKAENFETWPYSAQDLIGMIISFDMPANRPGGLPAQEYVDLVAYFMNRGGLPEGEEVLAGSPALSEIKIPQ
ncbi:c-type cytochrome [Roseitranquillus sediminis]|uniref:c-type cytochrome n=1 Tax=Roseitranquillus sediminis TaxID=2809051 RepID=UPI001D0C76DB|nr:cytochrome c [Roseitranquillus sediminis]